MSRQNRRSRVSVDFFTQDLSVTDSFSPWQDEHTRCHAWVLGGKANSGHWSRENVKPELCATSIKQNKLQHRRHAGPFKGSALTSLPPDLGSYVTMWRIFCSFTNVQYLFTQLEPNGGGPAQDHGTISPPHGNPNLLFFPQIQNDVEKTISSCVCVHLETQTLSLMNEQ